MNGQLPVNFLANKPHLFSRYTRLFYQVKLPSHVCSLFRSVLRSYTQSTYRKMR